MENQHHVPETVERFLESTLESVDNAEELAVGMAQRAGFDEDDLMKIGMAVRESMVNAVVHGNRYNANKQVRFSVAVNSQRSRLPTRGRDSGLKMCRTRWRPKISCAPRGAEFSLSGPSWTSSRCGTWNRTVRK